MFLIAMVTAQTLLIVGTSAISLTTCWKSNEVSKPQDPVESTSKPNEPEEKPPPPNIPEMAEDNANVRYVLQFNGDPTVGRMNNVDDEFWMIHSYWPYSASGGFMDFSFKSRLVSFAELSSDSRATLQRSIKLSAAVSITQITAAHQCLTAKH
uniref:Lipoprotein n=1 Tax=Angiostrongylus cantonensis TaxID=6313 RepID=A0A0K0DAZ4_ANGCA